MHPASADHLTVEGHKAVVRESGVHALSNHQLQQVVTRMNLEQQHRNLVAQNPTKIDQGHAHVQKILKIAKTLKEVDNLAGRPVGKALGKAATKVAKKVVKTAVGA
jgi:hypothetical protein